MCSLFSSIAYAIIDAMILFIFLRFIGFITGIKTSEEQTNFKQQAHRYGE